MAGPSADVAVDGDRHGHDVALLVTCEHVYPDSRGRAHDTAPLVRLRGLEVALGLERGHAARAGGRDRLAVCEVLDVARREDAGHAGLCGSRLHFDVVVRQQLDLAAKELRVRLASDSV